MSYAVVVGCNIAIYGEKKKKKESFIISFSRPKYFTKINKLIFALILMLGIC